MPLPAWFPVSGKTYVVLGLARSGLSTVRWLRSRNAHVIGVDDNHDKMVQAQALGATIAPTIPWDQVTALIQSPGVPLWFPEPHPITLQARQLGLPILGDGDLLRLANPNSRFIGITGTNGKSTTTALVGHILKNCGIDCQVGGNIGIPMLDLPPAETYVLELSSYQLDLSHSMDLQVAAWINLTEDHLDRHGTLENYIAAKKTIFQTRSGELTAIVGVDDAVSEAVWREVSQTRKATPVSVKNSLDQGISIEDGWLREGSHPIFNVSTIPTLMGTHNWQNVAIAYGICRATGLTADQIAAATQTFPGLAHRQEWIRTLYGIRFINDSKATNADATAKALETYDRIYWIAGGKAKSDGIDSLSAFFSKVVHTFLIGEAENRFAQTLEAKKAPYTKSGVLEQAVIQAYQLALADDVPNPVVLLSPACASYDQFCDFEQRGAEFRRIVQTLEPKNGK